MPISGRRNLIGHLILFLLLVLDLEWLDYWKFCLSYHQALRNLLQNGRFVHII